MAILKSYESQLIRLTINNKVGDRGIRLPNVPHGLNEYADVSQILFASSLNPTPDMFAFLKAHGMDSDAVRRSTYYATAYQSIMRTSLRSPESKNLAHLLGPDLGLAEYTFEKFPGAEISMLDAGFTQTAKTRKGGSPRKHASHSERGQSQRRAVRERKVVALNDLISTTAQNDSKNSGNLLNQNMRVETSIGSYSNISTGVFNGSIFHSKYVSISTCFIKSSCYKSFVGILKDFHKGQVAKEKNPLISPSFYDPNLSQITDRGKDNIVYCRHLWFDFENGELKPTEFPHLFPSVKMVVTNTSKHTKEKPRFRVIIPTTTIMNVDAYECLMEQFSSKIEDAGYLVGSPPR